MRRIVALVLFACLLATPARAATPALPQEGPDVPTLTTPAAYLDPFAGEVFSFEEDLHTTTVTVPTGSWDRIIVQFTGEPEGDPWDRAYGVTIGGAEVLRGTTPRALFTVRKDITAFASLLPPGGRATVGLQIGTFVGRQLGSVRLEFYTNDATKALVSPMADAVYPVFALRHLDGTGASLTRSVDFGPSAPSKATIEITLSGHGNEEDKFARTFTVSVDGTPIASATTLPYTYAFLGFAGQPGPILHPLMWWTAQQALDVAGVHPGIGEIPPYRASIDAANLPLLAGTHPVTIEQANGGSYTITGVSLLAGV